MVYTDIKLYDYLGAKSEPTKNKTKKNRHWASLPYN